MKEGLLPDGLEDLDTAAYGSAKLSAIHLAPKRSRKLIREGARQAAETLASDSGSFGYPDLSPPYVRTARFRATGDAPGWQARDEHPSSIIELMGMGFTRV